MLIFQGSKFLFPRKVFQMTDPLGTNVYVYLHEWLMFHGNLWEMYQVTRSIGLVVNGVRSYKLYRLEVG